MRHDSRHATEQSRRCQALLRDGRLLYSEGKELVGSWGGKGASRLGLEGTVDKFSFERLCDNLDPRSGEPLTVRTRCERTVGYDFTFSVPKSVITALRHER